MKLFIFIFLGISFGVKAFKFDQKEFNINSAQFGNKTANLLEIEKISKEKPRVNHYLLQVPGMLAISDIDMKNFLSNSYDNILDNWKNFQKIQKNSKSDKIEHDANNFLENIYKIINNYFDYNKFNNIKLEEFLADKQNKLLMVRSTGKEDAQELSNAGGNESIASVKPNIEDINDAIKKVIISYFSKKSLTQRLMAKDQSIFTEEPFMAVLLQEMIGEYGNNIPTSGVIFSKEPEGFTPGLTLIQSTFGHNEAVVNGLMRPDSFLVYNNMIFLSLVKKNKRLIPSDNGLVWKNNSKKKAKKPSLYKRGVLALKEIADIIENYYGYPMDIEFVLQKNVIYLVQARPLEKAQTNPSYIKKDFIDKFKSHIHNDLNFIGQNGGQAQIITDASQIIESQTLREALINKYLPLSNKQNIKAVVVKELAPSTSHEATEFRRFGVLTLVSNSLSQNTKYPIIIDPQRGLWVPYDNTKDVLEYGWYHHPLRPTLSILEKWQEKALWPEKLEDLKDDIFKKIYITMSNIIKKEKKLKIDPNILSKLKILSDYMLNTKNLIQNSDGLEKLFLESIFESLLFNNKDIEILYSPSLLSIFKNQNLDEKFVEELELAKISYKGHIALYARLSSLALTDDLKNLLFKFLQNLSKQPKDIQSRFGDMFYDLAYLDLLPLWLNNIFYKNQDLDLLLKDYEENKNYLEPIKSFIGDIKNYNFAGFEEFNNFDKKFNAFKNLINAYRKDQELFNNFNNSPKLAKMAALSAMRMLVEKFDLSIKALKASHEYSDELIRVERFKSMIQEYYLLMHDWFDFGNVYNDLYVFGHILSKIEDQIRNSPIDIRQLTPMPDFNVAGVVFGGKAYFEGSCGRNPTLENMFSLCHQNLLIILAALGKEMGTADLPLSQPLNEILKKIKDIIISGHEPFLFGAEINKDELKYFYNFPLENHSSTFQVVYNLKDKKIKMYYQFIGASLLRWDAYADFIKLLFPKLGIKLIKGPNVDIESGLLDFGVELSNIEQVKNYFFTVKMMTVNSFRHNPDILNDEIFDKAINLKMLNIIRAYFEQMPEFAIKKIAEIKDTVLISAFDNGNFDIFKLIVQETPNILELYPNYDNNFKYNFLYEAVNKKLTHMVEFLLDKAPQLACDEEIARDLEGKTALNKAFDNGYWDIAKLLIEKTPNIIKINPYIYNNKKYTFLHYVSSWGQTDMVNLLLEKAPFLIEMKNIYNKTALDIAINDDHWDIVKLLIEKAPILINISKTPKEEIEEVLRKNIQ